MPHPSLEPAEALDTVEFFEDPIVNLLFIEAGPFRQRFVQPDEMSRFDEGHHQVPARTAHTVKSSQPFDEQPLVFVHDLDALERQDCRNRHEEKKPN